MFKLNFKENIKSLISNQVEQVVNNKLQSAIEENNAVVPRTDSATVSISKEGPLQTDKYLHLIELIKSNSKDILIQKQDADNLFSAKSVITVFAFLLTSVLVQLDNALVDKEITMSEGALIIISLVGAGSTILARGAEGKTGVYTPGFMPGLNKEDYDNDNILNEEDETPFG